MIALSRISLLIIIGIFTLCVVATIRTKSVWPLAILGMVVFIGFAFLFVGNARMAPQRQVSQAHEQEAVSNPQRLPDEQPAVLSQKSDSTSGTTSWNSVDTTLFRTNIFPSVASAAKDLAKQIPELITGLNGDSTDITKLNLQATFTQSVPEKGQSDFQEELLKLLPNIVFEIEETADTDADTDESAAVQIKLDLKTVASTTAAWDAVAWNAAAWDANETSDTGTLSCVVKSDKGTRSISVDYIEKPWIEQLDLFLTSHPSRAFAVGISPTLCESPEAAKQSAIGSLNHIELYATLNGRSVAIPFNESLIIDRFLQKLERPYGDVWREAILVDLQSKHAQAIRAQAIAQLQSRTQRERTQASDSWFNGLILIAVFGATALLGMVLNLVTEGYLRGKIAGTLVAFAIAACIAFFIRMPW